MGNEALQIANIEFAVTSQIGRAPHWTMIRELTMNAIEAASKAEGDKIVHWTTGQYKGVRKAVIWNTGPGMNAAELKRATDLACEVGKKLGLDDNFGVGAKVSSLPNNRVGMRMRSCKNGRVSEVLSAKTRIRGSSCGSSAISVVARPTPSSTLPPWLRRKVAQRRMTGQRSCFSATATRRTLRQNRWHQTRQPRRASSRLLFTAGSIVYRKA
jgi:hypothetical protein